MSRRDLTGRLRRLERAGGPPPCPDCGRLPSGEYPAGQGANPAPEPDDGPENCPRCGAQLRRPVYRLTFDD